MAVVVPSPKERLLEVASLLFYAEGVHAVGVDRVIAEAGVAKATLYAHFAGKDELVAAYLARQSQRWEDAVVQRAAAVETDSIAATLTPFDVLSEAAVAPGYRGCPFINAAAEFPEAGPVAEQITAHRQRVRTTFAGLLGASKGTALLDGLVALYDGAMVGAYLDHDPAVVRHARRAAAALFRAHRKTQARRR
ncbi:MAG: TetR/AcrR family transcriptional regulator [Acidimicrobiales bacterium]